MFCKAKSAKKQTKNLRGDFTPFMSKSFTIWHQLFPLLSPKDSEYLKILDIGLLEMGAKRCLNGVNKWRKNPYKTFITAAILHPSWAKVFKSETTCFHFFPQGVRKYKKKFGHWTSRSGDKKTVKQYLKKWIDTHTHKHTNTHMDKSTYRKHWPREAML